MNKVKDAINGYTKPIEKLLKLADDKTCDEKALDVVAVCKQVEELTDLIKRTLVADANAEYQALCASTPDARQWPILAGEAVVSKYGAKGVWVYSKELIAEETALKAKMKEEQTSGKAKKLMPKEDPLRIAMYAVTLKQMPLSSKKESGK